MGAHIEVGRRGEELAAAWYRRHGYEIVECNWRTTIGEIDLIARRGRLLVICEVKARSTGWFGSPALAVGLAKQQRLRRLAAAWLATQRRRPHFDVRFDVVAVVGDDVTVYEGAF